MARFSPENLALHARPDLEANARGLGRRFLRRRQFLIQTGQQLRTSIIAVAVVFVLLLLLNLSLYATLVGSSEAAAKVAPELRTYFRAQDRFQYNLILLGSMVLLVGVFFLSILETHRTAGASFNICRCMSRIQEGTLRVRVRLRRGDNLREIEKAFNGMAQSLFDRTWEEVDALEILASRAEQLKDAGEARAVAEELRKLAERKRRTVV